MHKLASKFKESLTGQSPLAKMPAVEISSTGDRQFYYYRKHRGVNLGCWFVLEKWIADYPYQSAHQPARSDLDVAQGANAREILENHWDKWIQDEDWDWMSNVGINAVRIPIGYYHICGADASVLPGTDFQAHYDVFAGAWSRITRGIENAAKRGIGVLIDLHAASGKQNADDHSGTSNPSHFFDSKHHREQTIRVLSTVLRQLQSHAASHNPPLCNLIGIELINEPRPPNDEILKSFYKSAINELRQIDPAIPLYIGEVWQPDNYAGFVESMAGAAPIVLDHHLYRCFTPSDIHTSASDHAQALLNPQGQTPLTFSRVCERVGKAGGGMVVGEWSGALNPGSLRGEPNEVKNFVQAQLDLYERHCSGWFWWTFKKQKGGDSGWGFRDAVATGTFPSSVGMKMRDGVTRNPDHDNQKKREIEQSAYNAHVSFWSQYPGQYNHERFKDGFSKGWDIAFRFFDSGVTNNCSRVPELGFKGAYAKQSTSDRGSSYWEFEHGFFQGVDAARSEFNATYCS